MKKLMILCCFTMVMFSCQKDDSNDDVYPNITDTTESTLRKAQNSKINITNKYNDVASKRYNTEANQTFMSCTADPDDYQDCEVTFKVICIDDCGRNLMENGEVWITFEYYKFSTSTPSNTAYVKNNWGSIAGGGANLQIGQEYTLQHPVLVSEECPMYIWGEMWSPQFDIVGGIIYLEINGAIYYPINIWNIPYCTSLSISDPWPTPVENFVSTTLDENCYVSGRVDYVQDPCGGDTF